MSSSAARLTVLGLASGREAEFCGITADSRSVKPGWLFAALPGQRADGRRFIADAVARGAAAVLAPEGTVWPVGVPTRPLLLDPEPRRALALLAAEHAGPQPGQCVAVTGTNGKTSTVDFLRQLLTFAGRRAASVGTLGIVAGGVAEDMALAASLTTPDPVVLAGALTQLARDGVEAVAMEASSHGLDQFRLDGVRLAAAGFSNLTRDHLDYHGTMAAYRAAKLRLFEALLPEGAPAVADALLDQETLAALREIAARRRLTLRTTGEGGDLFRLVRAIPRADGQELAIEADGVRRLVCLPLPGRFQADNALLAAGLAEALGLPSPLDLLPRLKGVRGRMELAACLPNGAAAYVDYAHTPDALARLIGALRPHTTGKLHLVFGAGGDRDPGKRPLMGEAAQAADVAWVTDDNPRGENPVAVRRAILAACPGAREVGDRAACIEQALDALGPSDVLAVAGKGHETGQLVAGVTMPFDDVAVIRGLVGRS